MESESRDSFSEMHVPRERVNYMGAHMKTTIDIADPLLREAKLEARRAGITLRELIETGLRRVLDERSATPRRPFKLRDARNHQAELQPWIRPGDWEQVRDIAYGLDAIDPPATKANK